MNFKIAIFPPDLPAYFDTSVKVEKGILTISDTGVRIWHKENKEEISFSKISGCQLKKYYKVATYVQIEVGDGQVYNLFCPRVNLFNWLVINNLFKTKKLHNIISQKIQSQ